MSRTAPGQTGLCDADLVGRQEQEFQNNSAAEAWVQEVSSSVFRSLMPTPALESPAPFRFISMAEARCWRT